VTDDRAIAPALGSLRRFFASRPAPRAGEACEMCRAPLAEEHPHVVNVETRVVLCACRACYLLFTHQGAAGGKYRAVPESYAYAPEVRPTDAQWDTLQIPVGTAFFFVNSVLGRTVAFYPSPAGATESQLPLETWEELVRAHPRLAAIAPDVEALLVSRGPDGFECFLVPITSCYELVAVIRRNWKGFDGGEGARREIGDFFARLRERCGVAADGRTTCAS
jgi:hypothetical protein